MTAGKEYPQTALRNEVAAELRRRFKLDDLPASAPVGKLFQAAADRNPALMEPYRILANLPLSMYITTTPDNLLADALCKSRGEGSTRVEYSRWNARAVWPRPLDAQQPAYEPSPECPLLYYLFGSLALPKSVAVTEDDYFDHLLSMSRRDRMPPIVVNRRLVDTTLLFLGFHIAERIVLLPAPSGAGKTSLIQASLVQRLQTQHFQVLPIIRLNVELTPEQEQSLPPKDRGFNNYLLSAMLCLEEDASIPATGKLAIDELARLANLGEAAPTT